MKVVRIEMEDTLTGMWRSNIDGKPALSHLKSDRLLNLPMVDNEIFRTDDKEWKSCVKNREELFTWFSKSEIIEMVNLGFRIIEMDVMEVIIKDGHVLFAEGSRRDITDVTDDYTQS